MTKRDYYEVLGVPKNAEAKTIRGAFRKLAQRWHPDKNPGNAEVNAKYLEATEAHDVLMDQKRRAIYDAGGHAGVKGGAGPFGNAAFDDDVLDFTPDGEADTGASLRIEFEVSFMEAVKGCTKTVSYERFEQCKRCSAAGCEFCEWRGLVPGLREVDVGINPGTQDGAKIVVPGEGEPSVSGGKPGDLVCVVKVSPHPVFSFSGLNILSDVGVPFYMAILGGRTTIKTLRGEHRLEIAADTQAGTVFKLTGEGILDPEKGVKGDHLVKVVITVPKTQNPRQRELVLEYFRLGRAAEKKP